MHVTHRTLVFAGIALAVVFAWFAFQTGSRDVGVLRSFDVNGLDLYTTVWVVDDGEFVWIRANRPDRRWLVHVQQNPNVQLRRFGRQHSYRARVLDNDQARAYVDPLFREKYGLADRWRELRDGTDTIPIRLQLRRWGSEDYAAAFGWNALRRVISARTCPRCRGSCGSGSDPGRVAPRCRVERDPLERHARIR